MQQRVGTAEHEPGDREFATIAFLTQRYGLDWRTLRDAMQEVNIEPDFVINGIGYYSMREKVQTLSVHLMNTGLLRVTFHIPAGKVKIEE